MRRLKNILSVACSTSVLCMYSAPNATVYHSFLWGMYSAAKGIEAHSSDFFDTILLDDAASVPLEKLYIMYAYHAKQYAFVAHKRPFIERHCADDAEYLLAFARSLEHIKKLSEADAVYAQLEKKYPGNTEVIYHVIRSHIRAKRLERALACAQTCIDLHNDDQACAVFYYIQAQIYQLLERLEPALAALRKCVALSPTFEQGWFLWALLHEKMKDSLQAQKGYGRFLDIAGSDVAIEKKVISLLLEDTHHADTSWYDRAVHAFHDNEMSKALLLLSIAEKQQGRCDACQVLKLQIFDVLQRVDDLCALCTEILLKNTHDEYWLRVIHTLFLHTLYKQELLAVFDAVAHKTKNNQRLLLYALDCALRLNDYTKTATYYKKLVFRRTESFLKALVLYQVGSCAYEHRDSSMVQDIARDVYKNAYPYAPLLNFAAYYYSKYEKAYDRAQVLLDKALQLDPDNPHFKDTQAAIYLRTGDKEKAAKILQPLVYEVPLDKKIRRHRKKARSL